MLTGEYLVLKGAYALALPLKLGQSLFLSEGKKSGIIDWTTTVCDKEWFGAKFDMATFDTIDSNIDTSAVFISGILKSARRMNRNFLAGIDSLNAIANLEFDIDSGFGSSSTLINNIAYWSKTDPFDLHKSVSSGSGYDIAAAQSSKPIIFKRTELDISVNPVNFKPVFSERLYFGYLGRKQDTEITVKIFLGEKEISNAIIRQANDLTLNIAGSKDIESFMDLIAEHEQLLSGILDEIPIKEKRFPDYEGEVKSLGAWGGDFALFVSGKQPGYTREYLHNKGISPVYYYDEIVL